MGQTLVVQQRGLDLSIPGMISLATVLVTVIPQGRGGLLVPALGVVVLACVAAGLVSGIAVTRFGVTPLIATLGVNALLVGTVLQITSGTSTAIAARCARRLRVRADGRHAEHVPSSRSCC